MSESGVEASGTGWTKLEFRTLFWIVFRATCVLFRFCGISALKLAEAFAT